MNLHFSIESIAIIAIVVALIAIPVAYFGGFFGTEEPPDTTEENKQAQNPPPTQTPGESKETPAETAISIDRNFIYLSMSKNDSGKRTVTITNSGENSADIPIKINWKHEHVSVKAAGQTVRVDAGSGNSFELEFTSDANAEGKLTGTMELVASGTGSDKKLVVELTVEIGSTSAVKEFSEGNLYFSPGSINPIIELGGDRNASVKSELCNKGTELIKNIELSVTGEIADWIKKPENISGLKGQKCVERVIEINAPEGTALGEYTGAITAVSEEIVSHLELKVEVSGMRDLIEFSWADADFGNCSLDRCKTIKQISLRNASGKSALIDKIRVSGWSETDDDNSLLQGIELDNERIWGGNTQDGNWAELGGAKLQEWKQSRLKLVFSGAIKNNGEKFYVTFVFSDGSELKSGIWPVFADANSLEFSWENAEIDLFGLKISGWTLENKSDSANIGIEKMRVFNWTTRDRDNAFLERIQFDSDRIWSGLSREGEWLDVVNVMIPASETVSGNRLDFTQRVDDDFEQIIMEFELSNGSSYKTEPWPDCDTADLWELESDLPQPVDFSKGIRSSANTFGAGAGNDGWDWNKDVYITGVDCVRFNADPNADDSTGDSEVKADEALRIEIGDFKSDCADSGKASGAYGIEFSVSEEFIESIENEGSAFLSFNWFLWNHGLDTGNKIWLKSRIGTGDGMSFLGSNKDSEKDESSEFFYALTPLDSNGLVKTRIAEHFTAPGTYYLELGVKLDGWNDGEWAEIEFDNIDIVFG